MPQDNVFSWDLPEKDAFLLANLLDVDADTITLRRTQANKKAPVCRSCGRQIGLLDTAKDAIDRSIHGCEFFKVFFQGGDLTSIASEEELDKVKEVKHNIKCFQCGEPQEGGFIWQGTVFLWISDKD